MDIDLRVLKSLESEKEIPFTELVEIIEGAILAAYYRTVPPGWNTDPASLAGGSGNGSNTRSHVVRTSYSPRDYLLFSANLFLNDLAHRPPGNSADTGAKPTVLH